MQFDLLKRREFITLIGGAAVAWPLAAWAQQSERLRRIGVMMIGAGNDPAWQIHAAALRQGLIDTVDKEAGQGPRALCLIEIAPRTDRTRSPT
jgi:hypothetical protein